MSELQAVSYERHANKKWSKSNSFKFVQKDSAALLLALEIPEAHLTMPLGFAPRDDGYMPVAIQSLGQDRNLYVASDGQWLGKYLPFIYRNYPFRLGKDTKDATILCIDEAGASISEKAGELLFSGENTPAENTLAIFNTLLQMEKEKTKTRLICDLLQRHDLIESWSIKVRAEGDQVNTVTGMHRINETVLNTLPGDVLAELRDAGALVVAYAQLFSMRNLSLLPKLQADYAQKLRAQAVSNSSSTIKLIDENGIINFENL